MSTTNIENQKKVALITGCSSGIGFATAKTLASNGFLVVGTVRNTSSDNYNGIVNSIASEKLNIELLTLDLHDTHNIPATIESIIKKYGRIDVVVNNAGFGYISAVEDIDIEKLKQQYQVNVYAPTVIMQSVLPTMRKQKSGLIVNISSIMGFSSAALNAPYSSSKHAIANISETLALEANKFGIKVVVIEPGKTNTKFMSNVSEKQIAEDSPYKPLYERGLNKRETFVGNDPQNVADLILELTKSAINGKSYTVGKDAALRKILRNIMPNQVWVEFLKSFYKWK